MFLECSRNIDVNCALKARFNFTFIYYSIFSYIKGSLFTHFSSLEKNWISTESRSIAPLNIWVDAFIFRQDHGYRPRAAPPQVRFNLDAFERAHSGRGPGAAAGDEPPRGGGGLRGRHEAPRHENHATPARTSVILKTHPNRSVLIRSPFLILTDWVALKLWICINNKVLLKATSKCSEPNGCSVRPCYK